jgi:hypothetical protein
VPPRLTNWRVDLTVGDPRLGFAHRPQEHGDDDHSPAAPHLWHGGWVATPECPRSRLGTLLTRADAATTPRVYIVNAPADQSLADEVAFRFIGWGMVLSGAGVPTRRGSTGVEGAVNRLGAASVVVVLLTSMAVRDPSVERDAATAVAQARLDPTKLVLPVLLDSGADPDGTFAGHFWLVPSSNLADDVARAVFEALDLIRNLELTGTSATTVSEPELEAESIGEVRAAIAGTQARRRAVAAAVAILLLANHALVGLAVATPGDNVAPLLLTMISPLITFVGVLLGFSLGRRDLAYRRSRDRP